MKSVLKSNNTFLLPYFVFLLLGIVVLFFNSKTDVHLKINTFHNYFFDTFFMYFTHLGDGLIVLLAVIILLLVKYRYSILVGISYSISSIITQLLKHTLFSDALRPKKYFEGIHELHFVKGVENHLYNSFPSGHASTAFALYFSLALIVKSKGIKFLLFVVALFVGFSRVYLSQHFFEDVYAGSLIGVFFTFLVYWIVQKGNKPWLDNSLTLKIDK